MGILKLNLQHFAVTGFAPNWMNKYEIGEKGEVGSDGKITPPAELLELAAGIQTVDPSNDEDTEDYSYYGDRGGKQTEVTGLSSAYAFTGHRLYADDPAQEFVRDRLTKTGQDRVVYFKHTEPDGRVRAGNATLSGIVHTGGDANTRGNFEATMTFIGLPSDEKGTP